MKKLYEKSQLNLFFLWLVIYLLAQNLGYALSEKIGIPWSATALLNLAMAAFLFLRLRRQGLTAYYGLCRIQVPAASMLWFLPLVLLSTSNLWNGAAGNLPPAEMPFFLTCMACVGFLEELLFRGILFQYLKQKSVRSAVTISTLAFGAAHILNLFAKGGMTLADTLLQIAGSLSIGFLYAWLLLRSRSLWPCILSHAAINMLSGFSSAAGLPMGRRILFFCIEQTLVLGYSLYLLRHKPNSPS